MDGQKRDDQQETKRERRNDRRMEMLEEHLSGEAETSVARLIQRLEWFAEDCRTAAERMARDPIVAIDLVKNLSGQMQEIDQIAGEVRSRASTQHEHALMELGWEGEQDTPADAMQAAVMKTVTPTRSE